MIFSFNYKSTTKSINKIPKKYIYFRVPSYQKEKGKANFIEGYKV